MQKYDITVLYDNSDQEKHAYSVIMEAIYLILQEGSSLRIQEGENNGNTRGSA